MQRKNLNLEASNRQSADVTKASGPTMDFTMSNITQMVDQTGPHRNWASTDHGLQAERSDERHIKLLAAKDRHRDGRFKSGEALPTFENLGSGEMLESNQIPPRAAHLDPTKKGTNEEIKMINIESSRQASEAQDTVQNIGNPPSGLRSKDEVKESRRRQQQEAVQGRGRR